MNTKGHEWAGGNHEKHEKHEGGRLYDTWRGYPAFVPDNAGGDVRDELLTVTDAILAWMDILEGYPTLYRRERVKVVLEDSSKSVALVYVMNTLPRGAKVIPGGDWLCLEKSIHSPIIKWHHSRHIIL